ncbi:MAG TPA: hypothetical protein VF458_13645 [Ktedonobacteraceae bacterium]
MTDEYIYVTGENGEIYEVLPTEALLSFLQRLAEDETAEQKKNLEELELMRLKAI